MSESLCDLRTLDGQPLRWRHQPLRTSSPLHAWQSLLQARGLRESDAFFTPRLKDLPDPEAMQDMTAAADLLAQAVARGEHIHVFGDFDADGVCGTAILYQALCALGVGVSFSIPHRVNEGHGISLSALRKAVAQGATLGVSVDTGSSCHQACEEACALGMRMIITDHHLPEASLPRAEAVLNPARADCGFADQLLCGTGVAFFLLIALWRRLTKQQRQCLDLRCLLDRVALATVADAMDLRGVNRVLVAYGLSVMETSPSPGIAALLQRCRSRNNKVNVEHISFHLAPCINAAGRMQHGEDAFRLLVSESSEEAESLAAQLQQYNRQRQNVEQRIWQQACATLNDHAPLLAWHPDWHAGVVGLVAGRLARQHGRPAAIGFGDNDSIRLSLRGVEGFHVRELLKYCANHLQSYGGHQGAGGACLSLSQWDDFQQAFAEAVNKQQIAGKGVEKGLPVDGEIRISAMHYGLAWRLRRFAPIGRGNPDCLWLLRGVQIAESRLLRGGVLRLRLQQDTHSVAAVMFQASRYAPVLTPGSTVSLLGTLELDDWRGGQSVQFVIRHMIAV